MGLSYRPDGTVNKSHSSKGGKGCPLIGWNAYQSIADSTADSLLEGIQVCAQKILMG